MSKKEKTNYLTLSYGNVYFNGSNYQFNFNSFAGTKFEVEIFELKNVPEETEIIENRQIKQSVTTWRAVDKKYTEQIEKAVQNMTDVIDKKINGIEVESVVIEKTLIEPTKVLKLTDNFTKVDFAKITTYVNLSSSAVRIFVLNYLKSI